MAYTLSDYWFALKYALREGFGEYGQGLATSEQLRDAEAQYQREGAGEADSIFADRRKYNIEHGISLTDEQQRQQSAIQDALPRAANDGVHLLFEKIDYEVIVRGRHAERGIEDDKELER